MFGDERRVAADVEYSKTGGYFVRLDVTLGTAGDGLCLTPQEVRDLAGRLTAVADEAERANKTTACL